MKIILLCAASLALAGCSTTYDTDRAANDDFDGGQSMAVETTSPGETQPNPRAVAETPVTSWSESRPNAAQPMADAETAVNSDQGTELTQSNMITSGSLVGREVATDQGEPIGKIQDVVIDFDSGRITYAILQMQGADGGERMIAIPPGALRQTSESGALQINADKQRLAQAPEYSDQNASSSAWGARVYEFHGQQPYWHKDKQAPPQQGQDSQRMPMRSNAAQGNPSRDDINSPYFNELQPGSALLPSDRFETEADRALGQKIRQTLRSDQALNTSAKYLSLTINGGTVTVRGNVGAERAKEQFERLIQGVEGVETVKNNIEVKPH